ncbi:MAG: hypothetical protein ACRYGF_13690 [Janthinobacterium lividum]
MLPRADPFHRVGSSPHDFLPGTQRYAAQQNDLYFARATAKKTFLTASSWTQTTFGKRPTGVAFGKDGSMFVTDDGSQSVCHITYDQSQKAANVGMRFSKPVFSSSEPASSDQ